MSNELKTTTEGETRELAPAPKKRKFNRKHIKWIVLGAVVLVIVGGIFALQQMVTTAANMLVYVSDTSSVSYGSLHNAISGTGIVESAQSEYVYSTLSSQVQEVNVEVGDYVHAGDVLCQLDTATLEKQITEKELSLDQSKAVAAQSVKSAKDTYRAQSQGIEDGTLSSIVSSNTAVQNAYDAWQKAIKARDDFKAGVTSGESASLIAQEQALVSAQSSYDKAVASGDDVAIRAASDALDLAYRSLSAAERSSGNTLADYENNVLYAQTAYENALDSLTATEIAADTQLQAYRNSYKAAQANASSDLAEYQLETLKEDLGKATITAPVSGTVTAVYASVGASGSGLLFVIEDVNDLVVETSIKAYDINQVQPGMDVSIKLDNATSSQYSGTVDSISPTSIKNAQGTTDLTKDVLFPAKVKVLDADPSLRIGMSVRLSFVVDDIGETFYVDYSSLYKNEDGQDCILIATPNPSANETYILSELVVERGAETDLDIAIAGEGLQMGQTVITNPAAHMDKRGQEVALVNLDIASLMAQR